MKKLLLTSLCLSLCGLLFSQSHGILWTQIDNPTSAREQLQVQPTDYEIFHLNLNAFEQQLLSCKNRKSLVSDQDLVIISIPVEGDKLERFGFFETPVMAPLLQAKYPNIRTYTARGIDDPLKSIKLEVGPQGIEAMVYTPSGHSFITPAYSGDDSHYLIFRKDDLPQPVKAFECQLDDFGFHDHGHDHTTKSSLNQNPTGTELRTYRLALATTGEYSNYHGETKELVLAAMVNSMNRINGIYERDFTITFELVGNTDTLIFLDPETDPFTNNDIGAMLGENQTICDSLIGFDNYDIGHVFGTAGGGVAGFGVVCGGSKAIGATGLGVPDGDFFDVDYVSHEIGHQFAGSHTFNDCGGQGGEAYEPGSGVTIMAYAGLCGTSNLQLNSIDQFHVATYDQVIAFSQLGNGNTCPVITETGNTPPAVEAGEGGFYIPFNTPFELTGSASDIDGDMLSYCWEQFDLGPSAHPDSAVGTAPLFRSWSPVDHPTRIFPRIEDLVTNTQTIGELLPQFGRELNFRMTVRDNAIGGGGVDYDQITFYVADSSGNFRVLSPNGGQVWTAGSVQNISWDVADSDQSPVNCSRVNIWLSEDGGYTYPHLIATDRENSGNAVITVPNIIGNNIRVKVKAANNIFFDISNENLSIIPPINPDFSVTIDQPLDTICGAMAADFLINLDSILGFAEVIHLEVIDPIAGLSFSFDDNDLTAPADVLLTVTNDGNTFSGDYTFTLQASGGGLIKNIPFSIKIRNENIPAVSLISPFNGSVNVVENTLFIWNPVPFARSYQIEISDGPDFNNILFGQTNITQNSFSPNSNLLANGIYFWRVSVQESACGPGPWSDVFSFQTVRSQCTVYQSEDVPVNISSSGTPIEFSSLDVTQDFLLTDIDLLDLRGLHTWVSDLRFTLFNPAGDSIFIFGGVCGDNDDFNLNFDDDAELTDIPCPPTSGLTYQPVEPLAAFNGGSSLGTWSLKVEDVVNQDGGVLENWSLRLCGPALDTLPATVNIMQDSVIFGQTLSIDNNHLSGSCGASNDPSYQITSLPTNGDLYLNGELLTVGSFFSQSDIDNQLLSYVHLGSNDSPDHFRFILSCENGTYIGSLVYNITVLNPVNVNGPDLDYNWSLFPNPTSSSITIKTALSNISTVEIQLIDVLGRVVARQEMPNHTQHLVDMSRLPKGIYTCRLMSGNKQLLGSKKVILMD